MKNGIKKRLYVNVAQSTYIRVKRAAADKEISMTAYAEDAIKNKLFLDSLGPNHFHKAFTLKDKKIISNRWKTEFASNGWKDWICPDCDTVVWNDDVHVHIDWPHCPYCGSKIIEWEEETS